MTEKVSYELGALYDGIKEMGIARRDFKARVVRND